MPAVTSDTPSSAKHHSARTPSSDKPRPAVDRAALVVVLVLALFSGMAALSHEVLWTRRVIDMIGASNESSTRVFGCFFLGLSLGAAIASRFHLQPKTAWLAIAAAEFFVFLFALPGILLVEWTQSIWIQLGTNGLESWQGNAIKTVVPGLLVALPAVAMGLTLPWMVASLSQRSESHTKHLLWIYGTNTLGGVLGIFITVNWLLQLFGVQVSMGIVASVNVLISLSALAFWSIAKHPVSAESPSLQQETKREASASWWLMLYCFASGFGVLAFEGLVVHLAMLAAPLSLYAPAAILASFVLSLAIASFVFPFVRRWQGELVALNRTLFCVAAITLGVTPFLFLTVVRAFTFVGSDSLFGFLANLSLMILLTTGPAAIAVGLVFPAQLAAWSEAMPNASTSWRLGSLLAINGLGGFVGAEVALGWLLPTFGVHSAIGVVAVMYSCLAVASLWQDWDGWSRRLVVPFSLMVLCSWWAAFPLSRLPELNPNLPLELLDLQNGREGAVAVVEGESIGRAIIMSNQYVLGGSGVRWDEERQTHLPLVLHSDPKNVAFIGLATGITPGAALRHPEVDQVTAVELSPLVYSAADEYFRDYNYDVTQSERAHVVVEDGRIFMAAADQQFDVIVGDLFLPWGLGEGRLYSREHFQAVHRALRPGGEYCQWLAMYQLTPEQFDIIVATFREVFPQVHFFRSTLSSGQPALAMVGYREGKLNWNDVAVRCDEVRKSSASLDPCVRHVEGVGMLSLGTSLERPASSINTLNNLCIELDASKQRVTGQPGGKYLFGSRWLEFLAKRYYMTTAENSNSAQQARIGQLLAELIFLESVQKELPPPLAARKLDLQRASVQAMPTALKSDLDADWETWTGPQRCVP